ncbi:MAG: ABC transporter ATP-binding protein [Pseudomonadota bacterium]
MSTIEAKDLSVHFGDKEVLRRVSLTLRAGELTAIIGPNGAGKSTLLKAVLGLLAHSGAVQFDHKPRDTFDRLARARFAAYLPQGQSHAWPISVRDVVALGRFPHGGNGATENKTSNNIDTLLEKLGLRDLAGRPVLDLSGGEQMRVSLARALAVEAKFLFADEPLASLDPHYQFSIMQSLREEAEQGAGVVAVMHDLAMAARYAERILLVEHGVIKADGAPGVVLSQANMAAVFRVGSKLHEIETMAGAQTVALPDAPTD